MSDGNYAGANAGIKEKQAGERRARNESDRRCLSATLRADFSIHLPVKKMICRKANADRQGVPFACIAFRGHCNDTCNLLDANSVSLGDKRPPTGQYNTLSKSQRAANALAHLKVSPFSPKPPVPPTPPMTLPPPPTLTALQSAVIAVGTAPVAAVIPTPTAGDVSSCEPPPTPVAAAFNRDADEEEERVDTSTRSLLKMGTAEMGDR